MSKTAQCVKKGRGPDAAKDSQNADLI